MYGLEKLSIFMYLPYAAGLIAAKIVGPWILKRLTWSPLATIAWTEFFFIGPLDSKWFCDRCLSAWFLAHSNRQLAKWNIIKLMQLFNGSPDRCQVYYSK